MLFTTVVSQLAPFDEPFQVFPNGMFSDFDTFLVGTLDYARCLHLTHSRLQLTDWLAHIPKEVIARNFQTTIEAFDTIPGEQLYIFPGSASYFSMLVY